MGDIPIKPGILYKTLLLFFILKKFHLFVLQVNGISEYVKSCLPTSYCGDVKKACKNTAVNCKVDCCASDLCNKGAAIPMISIIVLLSSLIIGIFGI